MYKAKDPKHTANSRAGMYVLPCPRECSDSHFSGAVCREALGSGEMVVGVLRLVLALDMVSLSLSPVHPTVGLAEEVWHVLYALLPARRVGMPSAGVVQ